MLWLSATASVEATLSACFLLLFVQLLANDIANAIRAADKRVVAYFIFFVFILGKTSR